MSFVARITIDDEEMNVLHCSFHFSQTTDATGRPNAVPQGGSINLLVESDSSTVLFDWMISPTQMKNGTITFYRRDSMSRLKTLAFTDAYCIGYHETYDHMGNQPMQTHITLSTKQLRLNDSEYRNNWPQA